MERSPILCHVMIYSRRIAVLPAYTSAGFPGTLRRNRTSKSLICGKANVFLRERRAAPDARDVLIRETRPCLSAPFPREGKKAWGVLRCLRRYGQALRAWLPGWHIASGRAGRDLALRLAGT